MCVCVCVCVCVHRHTVRVCVCVCCQHSIIQQRASVQVMKTKMPTLLRRTGASRTASKCQGQVPGQRKTITGWVGGGGGGGFVSIHTMEGLKAQAGKKEAMMESHYWSIQRYGVYEAFTTKCNHFSFLNVVPFMPFLPFFGSSCQHKQSQTQHQR